MSPLERQASDAVGSDWKNGNVKNSAFSTELAGTNGISDNSASKSSDNIKMY